MIRKYVDGDIDAVMQIWLNTNIQTHSFISSDYWQSNFDTVKEMIPLAKIYVYEEVCYSSSLGEELQAYANKNGYKNKITCFSIKDEFILQGKCDIILKELHLDTEYISSYINKEGK